MAPNGHFACAAPRLKAAVAAVLLIALGSSFAPAAKGENTAVAQSPARLMTAAELDAFVTHYYLNPRPEAIVQVIEGLDASGFLQHRATVFVGFFGELFAAHPARVSEWRSVMDLHSKAVRSLAKSAAKQGQPGVLLKSRSHSVAQNDQCWGAFFASGNPAYLRRLAGELEWIDNDWRFLFWTGATAKWSLARNAPEHPLVRTTLEAARLEASPRTREIIDDVLAKEPAVIRQEIADLRRSRYLRDYPDIGALQDLRIMFPRMAESSTGQSFRIVERW